MTVPHFSLWMNFCEIYKMCFKSSRSQMLFKISFSIFTKKTICFGVSFNNVVGLEACNVTSKRLQHSYFPVSFAKFLITAFYKTPFVAASRAFIKWEQNYNSWFKTYNSKQKTQQAQRDEKLVFKKYCRKCRTIETRIKQNNHHTRIMCTMQFFGSFKIFVVSNITFYSGVFRTIAKIYEGALLQK